MKKKILAALMAAVMLFTILPLGTLDTAWAEERASATAGEGSVSGGKLLEGYLYRLAGMDIRSYENGFNSSSMAATYSAKANLNAEEQTVYNTLKAEIEKIASGQRKDTNIKTTGVLGSQASATKVWHALLSDLPYELYWHDKTEGKGVTFTYSGSFKDVTFSFTVAEDFRGADLTTTNIPNVPAAVQTARSVVAANASKADHDKLQAYRQYICDQVSYNYAAARGEYANGYGNPWQLLWVFDGDSTTNVVCEGYAKSFKYLCDLTEESNGWTGDVETISVTGTMGTENHMWNIVRIGSGNYLVDVTNCDTGMKGYPQKLFLRGAVGDGISYTVENTVYTYGTETRTGFAAADLKLSGTDYTPAATTLTAPTVTLKADAASGQPVISWSKVGGATQYEVYRSATGKANSFSIIRRTSALTYTDVNAAAGNTYYYVVRAMKGSGSSAVYSKFSPAQSIQYAITSLNAPTMTLTSAASGQPVVSWTRVNGAAQYEIYRSATGKANSFSIIRRTSALTYTDVNAAAGNTYYYVVRAISGSVKSAFCAAQSIQYAVASLNAPTMTLTSAASGQPVVSWTKVNGAAQYEVYRSTNGKNFSIVRRTAALSYTDTSAAAGTTYYYQVRAINGSVKSAFCAAQTIKYAITSLTAPTMTLKADTSSGQPVISWTKVNGAAQYEVYRSTNGKNFSIVRRTAALSYTDTSAAAGTTYYYQVRAINGSVKSDFCPAKSISLTVSEYGGECGSRATWRLTDDGVLTISGKDGIYEYGWYGEDDVYHPAPWAEEGMPAVKKLVVNSGITYIGSSTFEGLDQLTSVSLPDTMEYIGWGAFSDCASLTSIVVPEGIKVLYANTFARCTSLRSVKLPSTLEWINDCIFSGCTSLQDIVLPEGIDYIPWRMFDGCTSLRSVTIPSSIMSVSNDAFSGCTALTSVIFGGSRTDWENMTFNTGNDALRRVTPTCTGSTALAAPVVTGSTNRSGMPLIQWNKVSGAARYQLWCSRIYDDFGAVAYDLHADWDEEWFWDGNCCSYLNNGSLEDGVTYSYKVRAVDANGNVGAFSKEIRITFEPVLATPVISVTTNAQYQPVLAWDKVSGAGYYEVWRWCEEDETDQCIRRTAGLTWTDTTAELGKTYWYYLRAYSPDWNFTTDTGSYYSAWGYSMRWDVLDTPEITEVYSPEAGKAVLGWTKVSGADQYEIYRSTDGENYSIVRRTAALTWTDTTVQSGRVYYKIRAVVNVGSAKGYSDFLWTNFFVR